MRIKLSHLITVSLVSLTVVFSAISNASAAYSGYGGAMENNTTGGGWIVEAPVHPNGEKKPTMRQCKLRADKRRNKCADDHSACIRKGWHTGAVCHRKEQACYRANDTQERKCKADATAKIHVDDAHDAPRNDQMDLPGTYDNESTTNGLYIYIDRSGKIIVLRDRLK